MSYTPKFTSCEIEKIGRLLACYEALKNKKQVKNEVIVCFLVCCLHDLSSIFTCNSIAKALSLRAKLHAFEEEKQYY